MSSKTQQLSRSWSDTVAQWGETQAQWRDSKRATFVRNYYTPIEEDILKVIELLEKIGELIEESQHSRK